MKLGLKERPFVSIGKIRIEELDVMKTLRVNVFQQCFGSRKSRWDRCIKAEGEYFEAHGGE
jgi:hypothetical protein